jgi:hypothetical protein
MLLYATTNELQSGIIATLVTRAASSLLPQMPLKITDSNNYQPLHITYTNDASATRTMRTTLLHGVKMNLPSLVNKTRPPEI